MSRDKWVFAAHNAMLRMSLPLMVGGVLLTAVGVIYALIRNVDSTGGFYVYFVGLLLAGLGALMSGLSAFVLIRGLSTTSLQRIVTAPVYHQGGPERMNEVSISLRQSAIMELKRRANV